MSTFLTRSDINMRSGGRCGKVVVSQQFMVASASLHSTSTRLSVGFSLMKASKSRCELVFIARVKNDKQALNSRRHSLGDVCRSMSYRVRIVLGFSDGERSDFKSYSLAHQA
jgi:hypothetical protein